MSDDPRITAAEAMRRNLAAVAPIPQHISVARALEVMQTAEVRQQRGSNEVFHPSVSGPTAAQAMRAASEQNRREDLMNAPTAGQVMQAEIDRQRHRISLMGDHAAPEDGKPEPSLKDQFMRAFGDEFTLSPYQIHPDHGDPPKQAQEQTL